MKMDCFVAILLAITTSNVIARPQAVAIYSCSFKTHLIYYLHA